MGRLGAGAGFCMEHGEDGGRHYATCTYYRLCGSRPAGACLRRAARSSSRGRWLADAAWMEAASVRAFQRLARELAAHGAPLELVREARRAARDEARHARVMTTLARRHGERVPRVRLHERRVR